MEVENNIPEGWIESTLNELALINPRESIRKGDLAKNVPMDCIDSFTRKISRFGIKEFKGGTKFKNKDILLARITPCLENGKTALVDILDNGEIGFGSTEYIVIRENNDKSHYKFLYYLSISPKFRRNAIKAMTGTSGRQRVQTDVLINKVFRFPPLPEQKAIAKVLTAFDDKIELLQAQNKTLETMAQTIFNSMSFNSEKIESAESLLTFEKGIEVGSKNYEENIVDSENYSMFYRVSDLKVLGGKSQIFTKNELLKTKKFKKEDVLVSFDGTPGRVFIGSSGGYSSGIRKIKPKDNFSFVENSFIYYWAKSKETQRTIKLYSEGTTILHAGKSIEFLEISFDKDLILEIQSKIKPIFSKTIINLEQIQSLTKTRDTLLPKLMSGQVRVNNPKQTADA